jgi:hypothetical protein
MLYASQQKDKTTEACNKSSTRTLVSIFLDELNSSKDKPVRAWLET